MKKVAGCPCCGFPTLTERGGFEICLLCWWEDDGQDDVDADTVLGGPNGDYSLTSARLNFRDHGHMYDLGAGVGPVERPTPQREALLDYVKSCDFDPRQIDEGRFELLLEAEDRGLRASKP